MNHINVDELLKKVAVLVSAIDIKGKRTCGTGVIIQDNNERCYILTAEHCIYGKKNNRLIQKGIKIKVQYKYLNSDNFREFTVGKIKYACFTTDIALISVIPFSGYISEEIVYSYFDKTIKSDNLYFRGYPNPNKQLDNHKAKSYNCTFEEYDKPKFTIQSLKIKDMSTIVSIEKTAYGLSGSGLFDFKNGKLYLLGILTDLEDEHGTFGLIQCSLLNDIYKNFNFSTHDYNDPLRLLEANEAINRKYLNKSIKKYIKDNTTEFDNLLRKCKILYEDDKADNKAILFLENYLKAKIILHRQSKINRFLQDDFDNAKLDLAKQVTLFFDNRKIQSGTYEALGIYEEILAKFENLFERRNKSTDITPETKDSISINAINELLLNCDLDFKII